MNETFPLSDLALARRLERAEARANAELVEARAEVFPGSGACWIEVAGAYAMFDGVGSPLTQTFGLGLFEKVAGAEMDALEGFFRERDAAVFHEVSPIADLSVPALLNERGYRPIEFTSVLYRPIRDGAAPPGRLNARIQSRLVRDGEEQLWAETAVRGWSDTADLSGFLSDLAQINPKRRNTFSFLAELDGRAIAAAAMCIFDRIALLAGACTIPEGRKQGAQLSLLDRRLRYAAERGCDIAMMGALPGSASQRNAERQGFRIAYTRIKWGQAPR